GAESTLEAALELVFGRQLAGLVLVLGRAMQATGMRAALESTYSEDATNRWLQNPHAFAQAAATAMTLLEGFQPEGSPEYTPPLPVAGSHLPAVQKLLAANDTRGKRYAAEVLQMMKRPGSLKTDGSHDGAEWRLVNPELHE